MTTFQKIFKIPAIFSSSISTASVKSKHITYSSVDKWMDHILTYLTANVLMGLDVYTRSFHRNLIQFSLLKFLCYFWRIFWKIYIYDWCLTLLKKLEPIFFMSELPQFFHVWVTSIFSCLSYLNLTLTL